VDVDFSDDSTRIGSMSYMVGSDPSRTSTSADGNPPAGAVQIRVTDAVSGRPIIERLAESTEVGNDMALSPDGKRVAIGSADGNIYLYDGDTGAAQRAPLNAHSGAVNALVFTNDGTRIVSGGGRSVHVWAAAPDRGVGKRLPGLGSEGFLPAAVSPDGKVVATRDADNPSNIALRRIDTGELVRTISTGYVGLVTALAWRPDGNAVAAADGNADAIRMWNVATGEPEGPTLTGPHNTIHTMSFSADGHHLACLVVDSDPWLWDISASPPRGNALPRGKEDWVGSLGFSADGHRLVTVAPIHTSGDDGAASETGNIFDVASEITPSAIRVWNTETGEAAGPPIIGRGGRPMEVQELKDEVPLIAGAISPDGRRLLVGGMTGVRLYDVASGKPIGEPWADSSVVNDPPVGLRFSPDGSYVVSVDRLKSALQFRDPQSGRPVGNPLTGHTGYVSNLDFTADNKYVTSRGQNGWLLWPGPGAWRDALCDKLTTNLSKAEWDDWVSASPDIGYQAPCPSLPAPG
jgi:WD40 repeat protein